MKRTCTKCGCKLKFFENYGDGEHPLCYKCGVAKNEGTQTNVSKQTPSNLMRIIFAFAITIGWLALGYGLLIFVGDSLTHSNLARLVSTCDNTSPMHSSAEAKQNSATIRIYRSGQNIERIPRGRGSLALGSILYSLDRAIEEYAARSEMVEADQFVRLRVKAIATAGLSSQKSNYIAPPAKAYGSFLVIMGYLFSATRGSLLALGIVIVLLLLSRRLAAKILFSCTAILLLVSAVKYLAVG